MEEKIKLTIGVVISLILASGGTYYLTDGDDAFYCQSRDLVMICEKLSSGIGTRCYYEDTYKTCKEGWVEYNFEEMEDIKNESTIISIHTSAQIVCNQEGCVEL